MNVWLEFPVSSIPPNAEGTSEGPNSGCVTDFTNTNPRFHVLIAILFVTL